MTLWLDYESASECDLPVRGSFNYAQHPTTRMLCAAYAFDDEDAQLWWGHEPVPPRLAAYFKDGGQIRAHNEEFDRLLTWYVVCPDYGLAEPALDRWYCTAAQARANCAPGSLEDVGRFAGADMRKDHRGAALVRKCCIPPFKHTPQDLIDLGEYAKQDVRAMRAISKALRPLTDEELADYHVNAKINMRGVLVDVALAQAAQRYAAAELKEIQHRVVEVTAGRITSVRSPRMREWVLERLGPEARKLCVKDDKDSIDKSVRANLLAIDDPEEVPPDVREVIQAADDLWASSAAKFGRMAALADEDDHRVRGAFVFSGGSATGRASSYGLQVHNFPRPLRSVTKNTQLVRDDMVAGLPLAPTHGPRVTDVLKSMLRPALVPKPGHQFVVADWSAIEGRVHPWLSNCASGEAKLDIFRSGLDPYKVNAAETFHVSYADVTSDQRQIGKVQELALGFLGGAGAFKVFGRVYGVDVSEADAQRMVMAWRRANRWAMQHGQTLEDAIYRAMRNPGHETPAGRVTYLYDKTHLWYALPSGRVLCYPFAKIEDEGVTYAKAAWKPAADAKVWPRARLWRGLAVENVTQAVAHDILRHSLRQLDDVVLHVHDEIVIETADPTATLARMEQVMTTPPAWAQGLPLAIEAHVMPRYGKD